MHLLTLYVSLNHIGKKPCWFPMVRDIHLSAVPRIGEGLCLAKQTFGEREVVKDVVYFEDKSTVVEIAGSEIKEDAEEFEVLKDYYRNLGFGESITDIELPATAGR